MRNLLFHPHALSTPPYLPTNNENFENYPLFSSIPVAKTAFDLATLSIIVGILLLSVVSFSFIFYLRLRSKRYHHLENFNALWSVRLLLVSLASLWSVNEILRLPIVRRHYLYPFLPLLTLDQQDSFCKINVVLSLGLFEPGFLITLLFLVNVSIKKRKPSRIWALLTLLLICSPITLSQIFFVFISPRIGHMPSFMEERSAFRTTEVSGNKTMLCVYPFLSCVIFGAFATVYVVVFLISCWRVMALVINKSIRSRISKLTTAVLVALPVQILCLVLSWLWMPEDAVYGVVVLVMFVFVALCMTVGEVIFVLKPIWDALEAAGVEVRRTEEKGIGRGQ